ncbi:MAG: FHA domain-containing protein [Desulfobacteraceae bacterium]|nr:FHA domain-containing protein [Desulfobacteraceae bacterium]
MADWNVKLRDTIIKTFSIEDGQTVTIGRGGDCDLVIDNTAISRRHVSLRRSGVCYFLSDLGSTNGTFVNGGRILADEPVTGAESITFGKFTLMPAQEEADGRRAVSVSAAAAPVDEATVFVGAKRPEGPLPGFKPRPAGPRLMLVRGEARPGEFALAGTSSVKLGRDPSCDLVIPGWLVARAQAYIIKRGDEFLLVPQRSWAGTYVNGMKVSDEQVLRPGDLIAIRATRLRFD